MRVSLPEGTKLVGKNRSYEVKKLSEISSRSINVYCLGTDGKTYLVKVFDGEHCVQEQLVRKVMDLNVTGAAPIADFGTFQGRIFLVMYYYTQKNLLDQAVSVVDIFNFIIPQLLYVIQKYHFHHILLRDISPENILYEPNKRVILFTGLDNAVELTGRATYTKAPGYGQSFEYLAPEVERMGYGYASDFFSLGVTAYRIFRGDNPFQNSSKEAYHRNLESGVIPGIDVGYLKNAEYESLNPGDRIKYLIVGLLIANPENRWGYEEIRCWCNNQCIPWVQSGERVVYQFDRCITINGEKCWNVAMVTKNLAIIGNLPGTEMKALVSFLDAQLRNDACSKAIAGCNHGKAEAFKLVYTLSPGLNGFWWNGKCYSNPENFVQIMKNRQEELRLILINNCLSFYVSCREKNGMKVSNNPGEIRLLEEMEKNQPGTGVNRALVVLTENKSDRTFRFRQKDYRSIAQLLTDYSGSVNELKNSSAEIILNDSFQTWLWSRGLENAGTEAKRSINNNPQTSFTVFLSLCEACAENDTEKAGVRKLYLSNGEYAPIVWLVLHLDGYGIAKPENRSAYDRMKNLRISTEYNVAELSNQLNEVVKDYQLFVHDTLKNPFRLENEPLTEDDFSYYPLNVSYFFCTRWNNRFDVCPAFLTDTRQSLNRQEILEWLDRSAEEEKQALRKKKDNIAMPKTIGNNYSKRCVANVFFSIVMIGLAVLLLPLALWFSPVWTCIMFLIAIAFPLAAATRYHRNRYLGNSWIANQNAQKNVADLLQDSLDAIPNRKTQFLSLIMKGERVPCEIYSTPPAGDTGKQDHQEAPKPYEMGTGLGVLACFSAFSMVMLTGFDFGKFMPVFSTLCLYLIVLGFGIPVFALRRKWMKSAISWFWFTGLAMILAFMIGVILIASGVYRGMWIPIVLLVLEVSAFVIDLIIEYNY